MLSQPPRLAEPDSSCSAACKLHRAGWEGRFGWGGVKPSCKHLHLPEPARKPPGPSGGGSACSWGGKERELEFAEGEGRDFPAGAIASGAPKLEQGDASALSPAHQPGGCTTQTDGAKAPRPAGSHQGPEQERGREAPHPHRQTQQLVALGRLPQFGFSAQPGCGRDAPGATPPWGQHGCDSRGFVTAAVQCQGRAAWPGKRVHGAGSKTRNQTPNTPPQAHKLPWKLGNSLQSSDS